MVQCKIILTWKTYHNTGEVINVRFREQVISIMTCLGASVCLAEKNTGNLCVSYLNRLSLMTEGSVSMWTLITYRVKINNTSFMITCIWSFFANLAYKFLILIFSLLHRQNKCIWHGIVFFTEIGNILPAEFGQWRTSSQYSMRHDIRKNLIENRLSNEVPTRLA